MAKNISKIFMVSLTVLLSILIFSVNSFSDTTNNNQIIVWGINNTNQTRNSIGLNALRLGNSGSVEGFEQYLIANATEINKYNSIYIAFGQNRTFIEERAIQYSNLSLEYPKIIEIGIDDFLSWWENPVMGGLNQTLLNNTISNAKSINPNLKFGITLYEDNLDSTNLIDPVLSTEIRNRIDKIHLFIHFRGNSPRYPEYVDRAKALFPNAEIIAGSYAYDRINYIQCYETAINNSCTEEEELIFFMESIRIQSQMLNTSQIQGIEFYPDWFGYEEVMPFGIKYKCDDISRCIRITKMMRHMAELYLNSSSIIF